MAEQSEKRCSRKSPIFFILSYLFKTFSAMLLSLMILLIPVSSTTNSLFMHIRHRYNISVTNPIPAWVLIGNTGIYSDPASSRAIAHVSQHTPVFLTGYWQRVNKTNWLQVMWHAGTQSHTGWIDANSLTRENFSGISSASIGMLSIQLQNYLLGLGSSIGVAVYIPNTNQYYLYNADQEFPMASSMKVPIMLTMLSQAEQRHRSLLESEAQLLQAMIENSDNDAAQALYQEIGTGFGISSFLRSHGLSGIIPDSNTWGTSTASPQAMAQLLAALSTGDLLSTAGTSYALSLMRNIVPDQRFGVGDTAPRGAIVSMKDGWLALDQGWAVNSSGIVQTSKITYIVSVYTAGQVSQEAGMQILNTTCRQIFAALT